MHLFREKNLHLRAKPSLPDLKQQSTASATRLNPLDLARVPATHVPFLRPTSPVPSPRLRQAALPLTPPLTPSSSLDGARTIPEPSTPTDSETSSPAAAKGDADSDVLHHAPSLTRMPHAFSRYVNRNAQPSRFLLIANLPKNATLDKITTLFSGPSGAFKGIWAGKLAAHGVLVLIYFNIKEAELAYERYARGALVRDEMLSEAFAASDAVRSLRVGYLGLEEAKQVTYTGKSVSPVTEIEAEAAFFVHVLAPNEERVGALRAALERFGAIFVMEPRGWVAGGEWMYVEFFDARDSVMALHNAEQITSQQNLHATFRANQPGTGMPFLHAQRPPSPPMFAPPPPPARIMSPYYGDHFAPPMPFGFGPPPTPFFGHAPAPLFFPPVPPPTPFHPPQFALAPPFELPASPTTAKPQSAGPGGTPPMNAISFPPSPTSPTTARPFPPAPASSSPHRIRASLNTGASHVPPPENTLDLAKIERGGDMRTTVMIKNIPNKISDKELLEFIHGVTPRKVDFFYLRMDFNNGCNVGYAFVNFITVDDLLKFAKAKLGVKWNMYSSEKILQMSYANYQGKEALVEKFKNSGIMDEREAWRPKIFHSAGPLVGTPEPFPAATHQRRKERSAHNRGALYVPGVLHRA